MIAHACLVFSGVGWLYESGLLKKYASQMTCVLFLAALITMQTIVTTFANERKTYPPGTPMVATVKEYFIRDTDFGDLNRWVYESDESKVSIIDYTLEGNRAEIRLLCQQEGQYVDVPIFNYPGYGAFNEQGQRLPVATGSNNRIRVNLPASPEEQVITVKFVGKKIFWVGYAVTIGAFLGLLGYRNRERLSGWVKRTGKGGGK